MKFSLRDDFASFYMTNGYVILKDLFPPTELKTALSEIYSLFETRLSASNEGQLAGNDLLVHFYRKNIEKWKQCARHMADMPSIFALATRSGVIDLFKRLGLGKPMISIRPEVRTDMPADEKRMQPWHQDWRSGQSSLNSATIWLPLHKVGVDNGAIELIASSHLWGLVHTEILENPLRFSVVDPRIDSAAHIPVELELGECAVFSQMLVHRSGYNGSKSPRITVQLRYCDYAEEDYIKAGYPGGLYQTGHDLLWKHPPSETDMKRVYGQTGPTLEKPRAAL